MGLFGRKKRFSDIDGFGFFSHITTKKPKNYIYDLGNCKATEVEEFNIKDHKKGYVYVQTIDVNLIQQMATAWLIEVTKKLSSGIECKLVINSKDDVWIMQEK